MNLSASLFPTAWHVFMAVLTILILGLAARAAPWKKLQTSSQLNLALGIAVVLMLMWSLKAGVKPGLNLHLLGAMAATLALGAELALFVLGLALTGITLNGAVEWSAWPVNFVLMVAAPIGIASVLHRLIARFLPAHFFVFIFVTSFVGSAITVLLQGFLASGAMAVAGAYTFDFLLAEYLPFFLLLGFAEAWLGGAVMTLLVVYRPDWVAAFDDKRYLLNK
jgi:uncharacterized membrane protein